MIDKILKMIKIEKCPDCKKANAGSEFPCIQWITLENAINKTSEIKIKEVLDNIKEIKTPYPKDIFPPIQESDIKKISKEFPFVFGCSMDRFSAHLMRIARKNTLDEVKKVLSNSIAPRSNSPSASANAEDLICVKESS